MKNDTTFVRMRSGNHLGEAKMSIKGTSLDTAILGCIHVNGPGGRLIQPRNAIHVTFARFSQRSDYGVLCITLKLA